MMEKFTIMWAKQRNEFGKEIEEKTGKWLTSLHKSVRFLSIVLRYAFLIAFLFLLASHESANPKFGKTSVEFYREEFRKGISYELDQDYSSDFSLDETSLTDQFYSHRGYFPAWTTNFELSSNCLELIEMIASSYHYGLLPSNYHFQELKSYTETLSKDIPEEEKLEVRILLEKTATRAAIRLIKHMAAGMRDNDTTNYYTSFLSSIPVYLNTQIEAGEVRSGILKVQPESPQYERLQRALSRYLYNAIHDTLNYRSEDLLGNQDLISFRLIKQGYLDESFGRDSTAIIIALRNFQKAHNLIVNGELDAKTLEVLRLGTKEKFYKIALNLDRIRKDEIKNENSILVNIPEFRLHFYDKLGQNTQFNIIVGKTNSPTPLLDSKIDRIVTNPYWTVPKSITQNEILPLIRKDSLYLQKHGFTVVDNWNNEVDASTIDWDAVDGKNFKYWIRQTKMNNALGVVKFLFPNKYSVYLHDTQSKRLFTKEVRAFSHGCVRVQNPQELAQLLVDGYAENQEDVKKLIRSSEQKEIKMAVPVSIYIRYYSCTADSAGNIFYHPDIYALDEFAIQELFANSSWD